MRTILIVMFTAFVSAAAGSIYAIRFEGPQQIYGWLSYNVRSTLGLEKNWVRLPGSEQASDRAERNCPLPSEAIVLVIGGQSNASNVVPVLYEVERDVSVWFEGRCFRASDPMLGATSNSGSLWSVLGDRLAEKLDRPVLLIVGAVGGTQFGDWLDPRSGYYEALIRRVSTARESGYDPDMILWHQGETDAGAERNMVALEADVMALVQRLMEDIPMARLYLFQATRCLGTYRVDGVPEVIEVLQKVASTHPRIITGMNTDVLGRDYRWDTCHFNSLAREAIVKEVTADLVQYLKIFP